MPKTGIGSGIAFSGGDFATSPFTARVRSITPPREFVDDLDDTGLTNTDYKTFCPDDLSEIDVFDVEFFWNGSKPAIGSVGTLVLTFSRDDGQSSGATLLGSAYIKEWQPPELEPGTRKVGSLQVRMTGDNVSWTDAA